MDLVQSGGFDTNDPVIPQAQETLSVSDEVRN